MKDSWNFFGEVQYVHWCPSHSALVPFSYSLCGHAGETLWVQLPMLWEDRICLHSHWSSISYDLSTLSSIMVSEPYMWKHLEIYQLGLRFSTPHFDLLWFSIVVSLSFKKKSPWWCMKTILVVNIRTNTYRLFLCIMLVSRLVVVESSPQLEFL